MEQLQFDPNFQGDSFDPVRQVDYTKTLDRRNERLNRADQEALAQIRRNNQVRIQNAKDAGKDLIALSKLSEKLTNLVGDIYKEKKAEQDAEDVAQGFEMYLNGGLDMSSYNDTMGQAKDQSRTVANVEADVLGEDGENYEASSAISRSSAFSNTNVAKGFAMGAMGEYGTFMESQVNPADYSDRASYLAARRQGMKEFMKRAGLGGLKPQFLAQTIYPQIAQIESRAASAWSKQYAINDSAIRVDDAYQVFSGDMDVATVLDATRNTVDGNGKPLGYRGAWDLFDKRVTQLRKAGMLSAGDVESMKQQKIPGDPKGRTYGELYGPRFNNIEKQVRSQAVSDWNLSESERKVEFQQAEQQFVDAFLDSTDGDGFTDEQIDDAINTLRERFGFESSELATLKKNTVDAKTRKVQEEQIEDLITMNLLSPERLKKFDPKLQKKYMSTAQQQAKLRADSGGFKEQEDAVEAMVKHAANVTRDSLKHPSVDLMIMKQKQKFQRLITQYATSGDADPVGSALAQVMTEFQAKANEKGFVTKNGYPSVMPSKTGALHDAKESAFNKLQMDTYLNLYGNESLDKPDTLFNTQQLETMTKSYGQPGWSPTPQVRYIADRLGVDPLTVLNKQLKANDMTELPPSPAMEIVQNELSPKQQQLLNQYKTAPRSARAMTGVSTYKPELIPKGYGSMVEEAAKKHGLEPSIIAGLIETESAWNPNAVSSAGAKGLAQFMDPTAQEFGVIPFNPESAINGAAQYLKYLVDYFNGDLRLAIFAYNGGMGNIQWYGGPIPGNTENQEYYGKVIRSAGKYGYGKQALQDPGTMRPSISKQLQ